MFVVNTLWYFKRTIYFKINTQYSVESFILIIMSNALYPLLLITKY